MPLTEPMARSRYSVSDEAALARVHGCELPKTHAQRAIDDLTEQLHQMQRQNSILELQAKNALADAKVLRDRYNDLYKKVLATGWQNVEPATPQSYAEKMRAKRF